MTTPKLEQILHELYEADSSLRQHDTVLRSLVSEIIASKPNVQMDEAFRVGLRAQLTQLTQETKIKSSLIENFMNSFKLLGAGVAVIAVAAVGAWYFNGTGPSGMSNLTAMTNKPVISKSAANAFGSLAGLQQASSGQGGGGTLANLDSVAETVGNGNMGSGGGTSAAPNAGGDDGRIMIAPENPVNYRYVYQGEPLVLNQTEVDVLKRQKNSNAGGLAEFINRVTLGLVNFGSFSNTRLESFNFKEDRELGYMVNVNVAEGTVNIHENWPRWEPLIAPAGRRVDISEVPADSVITDAANAFLDQHGIDRTVYGTPVVNADWRVYYNATPNKADYWIPEVMNVVYPQMIDGQQVYDESGNPSGLNVGVRIAPEVRVTGVWELTTQNYQSSAYQAETSVERVMSLVERGGFRNYYYAADGARTVDVEVGTPDVAYVKLWDYKNGLNEELLVPALVFPVLNFDDENLAPSFWYRKNIVIPLVKEILDNENSDLPVRILPAAEPAATGGSSVDPTGPAIFRDDE